MAPSAGVPRTVLLAERGAASALHPQTPLSALAAQCLGTPMRCPPLAAPYAPYVAPYAGRMRLPQPPDQARHGACACGHLGTFTIPRQPCHGDVRALGQTGLLNIVQPQGPQQTQKNHFSKPM